MKRSIKDVFKEHCKGLEVNDKLVKAIKRYDSDFINKNQDHITFFGGNLLGVQKVRFVHSDRERWFYEILGCDESQLQADLLELDTVYEDRAVTSDAMNLSCVYLAHLVANSTTISKEAKHETMVYIFSIMLYKFLTSRLSRLFKYTANEATAEATYSLLSKKYDIKQLGNWLAVIRHMSNAVVVQDSIHYQTILRMNDDPKVSYVVSDIQTRIRNMLKGIYGVHLSAHEQGLKIGTTSSIIEHDGEAMLKDKTKSPLVYIRYISEVITDKESFMREELLVIIEKLMHTMSPRLFRDTLDWMSKNYRQRQAEAIDSVISETIIHSLNYFNHNRNLVRHTTDLPELLSRLRGVYMSSRSTDPVLLHLRDTLGALITTATGNKNETAISSARTGVMLYIVLRTMTMRYYTQGK